MAATPVALRSVNVAIGLPARVCFSSRSIRTATPTTVSPTATPLPEKGKRQRVRVPSVCGAACMGTFMEISSRVVVSRGPDDAAGQRGCAGEALMSSTAFRVSRSVGPSSSLSCRYAHFVVASITIRSTRSVYDD